MNSCIMALNRIRFGGNVRRITRPRISALYLKLQRATDNAHLRHSCKLQLAIYLETFRICENRLQRDLQGVV